MYEILMSFLHVFAMKAPWLVCGVVMNMVPGGISVSTAAASEGHALSAVHWVSAVFLAVMMVCNIVRPVGMGHRHK